MRAVLAAVAVFALTSGAATAARVQHFFFAPGVTTSCEMDAGMPKTGTVAYCQTTRHLESVVLHADGHLTICHGAKCIGNPPEGVPTLTYGAWLDAGPFRCTSLHAGVRCVVRRTGHGFLISSTAIKHF